MGAGVLEIAKAAVQFFTPPPTGAINGAVTAWRWKMVLGGLFMASAQVTFLAYAFGAFATFGFNGFAYAGTAADQGTQIDQIRKVQRQQAAQLERLSRATEGNGATLQAMRIENSDGEILKARDRQCQAIRAGNAEARSFATERLQVLLQNYQDLTTRVYRLPACEEL